MKQCRWVVGESTNHGENEVQWPNGLLVITPTTVKEPLLLIALVTEGTGQMPAPDEYRKIKRLHS